MTQKWAATETETAAGRKLRAETSGIHWLQKNLIQVLKTFPTFKIMTVCPITFELYKWKNI